MAKKDNKNSVEKRLKTAKRLVQISRFTIGFLIVMVFFNLVSGNYAWAGLQGTLVAVMAVYLRDIRKRAHK